MYLLRIMTFWTLVDPLLFPLQDIFGNLNDAMLSRASTAVDSLAAAAVDIKHSPASMNSAMSANPTSTTSMNSGGGNGNGFPHIKTDMMYTHAAAAAAAGIPVSSGGGSPTSGLANSRLHQVRRAGRCDNLPGKPEGILAGNSKIHLDKHTHYFRYYVNGDMGLLCMLTFPQHIQLRKRL